MKRIKFMALLSIVLVLMLSSCGGSDNTTNGGAGVGDGSDGGASTPPAAPTNLAATGGDGQVTLTWDAVEGVDSYAIHWKKSPGVTKSDNPITGAVSPYVHNGLTDETTFYYAVTSVKGSLESELSNEANAVVYLLPRAFVTSVQGTANLGGWAQSSGQTKLDAGDAICQKLATDAGLGGTFKALLSDDTTDARDRITTDGPWTRVDKVLIAESKSDLFDGTLSAALNLTETGASLSTNVWTGSNADGTSYGKTCSDWSSENSGSDGRYGIADDTTSSWFSIDADPCDSTFSIYCLED